MSTTKSFLFTASILLAMAFTFSCSSEDDPAKDEEGSCDINDYGKVDIGGQIWMTENLNCNVTGSKCNGNKSANCNEYGRLYDWETAMELCHNGWHLPSAEEWEQLKDYIENENDCSACAGKYLKANGDNPYGFSALPGGSWVGDFEGTGYTGYWWSSESNNDRAFGRSIDYSNFEGLNSYNNSKTSLYSVRCVQN
jgi:uncharacterized protein (TIGR02145 family)